MDLKKYNVTELSDTRLHSIQGGIFPIIYAALQVYAVYSAVTFSIGYAARKAYDKVYVKN